MPDFPAVARAAADAAGIDRELFVRQINQESGFNPEAFNEGSGATGIAQIVRRFHPGVDPTDPVASLYYAANLMRNHLAVWDGNWALALSCYNAGPGATAKGVAGTLDGWPYAETVRYVRNILDISEAESRARLTGGVPVAKVTYDRAEPAIAQGDSWSCGPTATRWGMHAVGRSPSEAWIEATMIAEGVVSMEQGILDGSGAGIAAFIKRHYAEFGYDSNNEPRGITFQALAEEFMAPSNPYPGLIGGTRWNHWSGLRGYDSVRDVLLLANPSDGWGGVGQIMSRSQFANLGSFSLVRVLHPDLLATVPTPPPAPDPIKAQYAVVERELAKLGTLINSGG